MKTIDSLLLEKEVIEKEYKIRRFKKVYNFQVILVFDTHEMREGT